jgi:hypothetical protein
MSQMLRIEANGEVERLLVWRSQELGGATGVSKHQE